MMLRTRVLAATLLVGIMLLGASPSAAASPPDNDNFANADVVASLPFTDSGDLAGLTTEDGEPSSACLPFPSGTAWYVLTPTTSGHVIVDPAGSGFTVGIVGWQSSGGGFEGLSLVACGGGFGSSPMVLPVTAGSTYYVQVGLFAGGPSSYQLRIDAVTPPPNDAFVGAEPLSGAPVSATVDLTTATLEPGEPGAGLRNSAWYAYTPVVSGPVGVRLSFDPGTLVNVYTGGTLSDLTQIASGSGSSPGPATFSAVVGTTYFLQVAEATSLPGFNSVVTITIEPVGPPNAYFDSFPSDPSIYDDVHFVDWSTDPAFMGFGPAQWDFGDGTTTSGCCTSHRYAADGDYTVTMIATTLDGRTATTSRVVSVRTRDVSIERIQAPGTARVGQAKDVRVNVRGGRQPETVQVELFKSVAGGFEQLVGTQTLSVPVAHGGRTTRFDFRYTFTAQDGAAGKVTFRAVATIVGGRDALPADNQAIAPPTAVKR